MLTSQVNNSETEKMDQSFPLWSGIGPDVSFVQETIINNIHNLKKKQKKKHLLKTQVDIE